MPNFTRDKQQPWDVRLTTPDGQVIDLVSVGPDGKPKEFEGALTPVDATESFRPGGIPKEWNDWSAGAGYSYDDDRVPNGYSWGKNVWALTPHAAHPAGALTEITLPYSTAATENFEIRCGFEANGHLYVSTGRNAIRVTADVATIAASFTSVSADNLYIATSVCVYRGNAYWGGYNNASGDDTVAPAAPLIQQTLATDTFTSNATCLRFHVAAFEGLDGNGNWSPWMIGTFGTNVAFKVTNSTAPLEETNWTPAGTAGTLLGSNIHKVNSIIQGRQAPYILTTGGVRIVLRNGVQIPNITPHWLQQFSSRNGIAGALVGGRLYASVLGGIDMIEGLDGQLNDTPNFVHPGAELPNENPAVGTTWAICPDGDWIVAGIYNSFNTTSYICWGRPRATVPGQPGLTTMVWHVAPCVIEGERVTWLHVAKQGDGRRLWIATRNSANTLTHLYGMYLPISGNPIQDLEVSGTWRSRTDECVLYFSRYAGAQGMNALKAIRQVGTVAKASTISDTSYLQVKVSMDDATAEQLGANVTENYTEARILDDVNGREIEPQVTFKAGSSTTPPVLRSLTLWSAEGVRATMTYRGRFRFAPATVQGSKGIDTTTDQQAKMGQLFASQGPRPATMIDWKSTVYFVAFEQGAVWPEREVDGGERFEADVVLTFTVLARQSTWNDGSLYDTDAEYSP